MHDLQRNYSHTGVLIYTCVIIEHALPLQTGVDSV